MVRNWIAGLIVGSLSVLTVLGQNSSSGKIYNSSWTTAKVSAYSHNQPPYAKAERYGANGTLLRESVKYRSAAADWSVFPLGTVFRIKDFGGTLFVVDDHQPDLVGTSGVKLYFNNPKGAKAWWARDLTIEVLRKGELKASYLKLQKVASQDLSSFKMAKAIYQKLQVIEAEKRRIADANVESERLRLLSIKNNEGTELPAYVYDPVAKTNTGVNLLFPTAPKGQGNKPFEIPEGSLPELVPIKSANIEGE